MTSLKRPQKLVELVSVYRINVLVLLDFLSFFKAICITNENVF